MESHNNNIFIIKETSYLIYRYKLLINIIYYHMFKDINERFYLDFVLNLSRDLSS